MVPSDIREDYEILFLEKGTGRLWVGDREYPIAKGDIISVYSREGNAFAVDQGPCRFSFITFKIEPVKNREGLDRLNVLLTGGSPPMHLPDPQRVMEIMSFMQKEIQLKPEIFMFRLKLCLGELAALLSAQIRASEGMTGRKMAVNRNASEFINSVVIYLQENYNREINLAELGRLVNLHPRYLCSLFKQVTGRTINEFLREIRIHKAKRLLAYTTMSITDIALETGFNSSPYFSRIFSQCEGTDPRTYRKINCRNI